MHLKKDLSKLVNFCTPILILKIGENKQHFQWIMLYYFKKGKNATEMQVNIYTVYGEGVMTDRTCQKCFVKFCAGDFSCCTMLHGQVEQLKLIAIKSRHY